MAGFDNDVVFGANVNFSGTEPKSGTLLTDGQLLIAHTALNAGSTHIDAGKITSPLGTINIGYSNPNITLDISGGGKAVEHLTGNTGGILNPDGSNNFNLLGPNSALTGYSPWVTGSASTLTFNMPGTVKWVVNPVSGLGTHTTIASAISSASSGDDIFITPGTYTENITLKAGVNLIAYSCDSFTPSVTIIGKVSVSYTGTSTISNIYLQTNSDYLLETSGSNVGIIDLYNCYLNCLNNTGIHENFSVPMTFINLYNCNGNIGTTGITLYSKVGAGSIYFYNCNMANSGASITASNSSQGNVFGYFSTFYLAFSTTNASSLTFEHCTFDTNNLNSANTIPCYNSNSAGSSGNFKSCYFISNNATTFTLTGAAYLFDCVVESNATNIITGSGGVYWSRLSVITVSNANGSFITCSGGQNLNVTYNDLISVASPSSYPYTVLPQDALVPVDTSSARTINLTSTPKRGQNHIIKDNIGSAASNNITVSGNGNNIDGSSTFVINSNYGSINVIYNGTQWNVT